MNNRSGFTLVELLVAVTVSSILLILLASVTTSSANLTQQVQARLAPHGDARVAHDFFERDLGGLTPAERNRTTLTLQSELVEGRAGGPPEVNAIWLMMLTRSMESSQQGAIRAVSYRLQFTDPMTPGGAKERLALYRTEIDSPPTVPAGLSFLDVADLHQDFWATYWPTYEADNSGRTLLEDYLVEGIVEMKVVVNYLDAAGVPGQFDLPAGGLLHWTSDGFSESSGSLSTPNLPVSLTLILTSLREEGMVAYESGAMSLADALERHGFAQSRTFPIVPTFAH